MSLVNRVAVFCLLLSVVNILCPDSLIMEDSLSTSGSVRERNTEGKQDGDRRDLLTTKPLHRFVQREPKSLGVVILIFGCAELLMGFVMFGNTKITSSFLYVPFWQGVLFMVCGALSIYTGIHPSKKMVTVSLSMYIVSLFGILFSIGSRITFLILLDMARGSSWMTQTRLSHQRGGFLMTLESLMLICSICVCVMLIFLSCVARLALKSTRTQLILHQIPPPVTEPPAE